MMYVEKTWLPETLHLCHKAFSPNLPKVALWSNLEKLLEVKRQCLERAQANDIQGTIHREPGTETLVL
jgi:hypothetical protein